MVFKTLHLARQSLSKTLTHGYAQSVVAASQSSYASQNNSFGGFGTTASRFAKLGPAQFHNAFQTSSVQTNAGVKAAALEHSDSGLAAYYAAWQKHQRADDKEWSQFQFAKRIGWKTSTPIPDAKAKVEDSAVRPSTEELLVPSNSNVTPDDSRAGQAAAEKIEVRESDVLSQNAAVDDAAVGLDLAPSQPSAPASATSLDSSSIGELTPATTVSEVDSYALQFNKLVESQQYADIPPTFESMLLGGVRPTTQCYNALLVAAIKITKGKHQVVPKALDVYADMLRRRITPDSATYDVLLSLLSSRAIEVSKMKEILEEKRARYGGMDEPTKFMFRSNEAEYDILAEDDSLNVAVKLFNTFTNGNHARTLSEKTYYSLIAACAEWGRVEDMVHVYSHMELRKVLPSADIFSPMINAFAASGDLRSAVECYDEYKALAIANDKGHNSMVRKDEHVYAALIKAYSICERLEGGMKFLEKVRATVNETQLQVLEETVGRDALLPGWLKNGHLDEALHYSSSGLTSSMRVACLLKICTHAADTNNIIAAATAFNSLPENVDVSEAAMALTAMHIRNGNTEGAESFWKVLEASSARPSFIEPTAMYTVASIGIGDAERGLRRCRQMFSRIRDSQVKPGSGKIEVVEQIDEAIEVIGYFMVKRGIVLPPKASMELMWSMIDNGGLVTPVAGHLLAGLGPDAIAQLGWDDVMLLLQVQAGMIANATTLDIANSARFAHLLDVVVNSRMPVNEQTASLVENVLSKLDRPDLTRRWQQHLYHDPQVASQISPPPYTVEPINAYEDNFDPYAANTDNKGSVAITDLLDKAHGRTSSHLNEALTRFKNIRRAGRHPRFFTYAKLISAAAKDDRLNLAHDILNLAKQDVPLLPQYRIVRYGWVTILDAMVAACLTTGQRHLAAQYHRDLLDMGAAPSANTFGLYITTMKESTKTFDEASEAVKIFLRAKSEGVEPSSFLYNALIGKLGKARRIDDCLFYFAEMRNLGIRPTSVTYGTIVNALCRVSDEKFAEELFEEMESMPNYKPRPAPYHSLMQYFLSTKRDREKVLCYYERMVSKNIQPTMHTYKLLIDTHATLEPVNMPAAEAVLDQIRESGGLPEAVHYASLIHAKGCVLHDMEGAFELFKHVDSDPRVQRQACLYQALFEAMVANHRIEDTEEVVRGMAERGVAMTPYIANSLIHGWAMANNIGKARAIFKQVAADKREPSTYEAMTRAFMAAEDRESAMNVVNEALARGYPTAVANKIMELVGGGRSPAAVGLESPI